MEATTVRTRIYTKSTLIKKLEGYSVIADHSVNSIMVDAIEEYLEKYKFKPKRIDDARSKPISKKNI